MEHECALLVLGKAVQGFDDIEVAHPERWSHFGFGGELDESTAPLTSPAVGRHIVKHPPRPSLWIVVSADAWPLSPGSKEHLLDEVTRVLDIASEQVSLRHQRSPRDVEEPLEAALHVGLGQSALPSSRHFTPTNTQERPHPLQPA
jgi:hypothetical protein